MDRTFKFSKEGSVDFVTSSFFVFAALFVAGLTFVLVIGTLTVLQAIEGVIGWPAYPLMVGLWAFVAWALLRARKESKDFQASCKRRLEEFGFLNVEVHGREFIRASFPGYPDVTISLNLEDSEDNPDFSCSFFGRSGVFSLDGDMTAHELQERPDIRGGMVFMESRNQPV